MAEPFEARYRVLAPTMGVVWVEETTYVARAVDGDPVVLRGHLVLS